MSAFSSTLTVNSLFWFTSLGPTQQGLTRRILEDLMPYLDSIGLSHQTYGPQTADQLRGMLNEIARKAAAGLRPVLHFDTHGNATHGIKLDASGEFVSWPDLVVSLRAINVATRNNLCVISGACFSMEAAWQVTLSEPCPFFILIAPKNEVSSGFLEDNIVAFYKSLFEGREVVEAHKRHLAPNLELFHCERMLAYMLARYVRDYCTGKGGNKRREQLLTKAVEANYVHNRSDLRRIRRGAKAWTRPSQAMIERFANGFGSKFLMGKPIGFDIDDVMTFTKIVTDRRNPPVPRPSARSRNAPPEPASGAFSAP
jgi:hypothetical protein